MKNTKTLILFTFAGTASFIAALALYSTMASLTLFDIVVAAIVLLVVVSSIPLALNRLKKQKKGLTVDDELSHSIKEKAGAKAFAVSLYVWTFIMIFTSNSTMDREIPFGIGIISMGLIFIGFWLYHSKNGVGDENQA